MRRPYSGGVLRAAVCAALAAGIATIGAAAAPAAERADASVFGGLGTWVDIYDGAVYGAPERSAQRMSARGVKTVWVETANFGASVDVVKPLQLGRFVDALHARGIRGRRVVPAGAREARARRATRARHARVPDGDRRPVRRRGAQYRVDEASERDAPLASSSRARRSGFARKPGRRRSRSSRSIHAGSSDVRRPGRASRGPSSRRMRMRSRR